MTCALSLLAFFLSSRTTIMVTVLAASIVLLLGLVFLNGRESAQHALSERQARHHFEVLKEVNDAIDDLGRPIGDDLRCLLKQRGEIRDRDDLLCP
jgi:hypothetical protein